MGANGKDTDGCIRYVVPGRFNAEDFTAMRGCILQTRDDPIIFGNHQFHLIVKIRKRDAIHPNHPRKRCGRASSTQ